MTRSCSVKGLQHLEFTTSGDTAALLGTAAVLEPSHQLDLSKSNSFYKHTLSKGCLLFVPKSISPAGTGQLPQSSVLSTSETSSRRAHCRPRCSTPVLGLRDTSVGSEGGWGTLQAPGISRDVQKEERILSKHPSWCLHSVAGHCPSVQDTPCHLGDSAHCSLQGSLCARSPTGPSAASSSVQNLHRGRQKGARRARWCQGWF